MPRRTRHHPPGAPRRDGVPARRARPAPSTPSCSGGRGTTVQPFVRGPVQLLEGSESRPRYPGRAGGRREVTVHVADQAREASVGSPAAAGCTPPARPAEYARAVLVPGELPLVRPGDAVWPARQLPFGRSDATLEGHHRYGGPPSRTATAAVSSAGRQIGLGHEASVKGCSLSSMQVLVIGCCCQGWWVVVLLVAGRVVVGG